MQQLVPQPVPQPAGTSSAVPSLAMCALLLRRADAHAGEWLSLAWLQGVTRQPLICVALAAEHMVERGLLCKQVVGDVHHYGVQVSGESKVYA